jgi:hypothetical protein
MYDCPDSLASEQPAGKGKSRDFDLGKAFRWL